MKLLFVFFALFTLVTNAFSQPPVEWMRMYDNENSEDAFTDIYAVSDGGYVMCGSSGNILYDYPPIDTYNIWIVRIDDGGDVIWSQTYAHENDENSVGFSIIETEDGDFLVGGRVGYNLCALLVENDGDQIWFRTYQAKVCQTVIELKSGEFLLAGRAANNNAYLMQINGAGDILWDEDYDGDRNHETFYSMRETEGGVVLVADVTDEVWAVKVNFIGEIVWSRFYDIYDEYTHTRSIVADFEEGFIITGFINIGPGYDKDPFLIKISDAGELEWTRFYDWDDDIEHDQDRGECIARLDDGFALVGYHLSTIEAFSNKPIAYRVHQNGVERWRVDYDFADMQGYGSRWNRFHSVVQGHDRSIIAAGLVNFTGNQTGQNGILVKLEPEILEPQFVYWLPEDTVFSVLQGDTINFLVRVFDQQEDQIEYLWIMGDDTLSIDTTTTVIFEDLGDFNVQCQVSDGEFIAAVTWRVSVVEWYIDTYHPDSLDLILRRNETIDFSVDVRAVDDDPPIEYFWLFDGDWLLDDDDEIIDEDSASVTFNQRGREHSVEAIASRGNESDNVVWNVLIQALIVDWWPELFEMRVPVDTVMQFVVDLFDPEADSLSILWTLD
ncbi:MAG: hypothetical protein P9M15_03160, partial [Candidatus Electryoneaceae bacterium]|nr:hypothetical protein [Candidatus Electryoneaceae bacterium]